MALLNDVILMFVLEKANFNIKLEVRFSNILAEPLLEPNKDLHKSTRLHGCNLQ